MHRSQEIPAGISAMACLSALQSDAQNWGHRRDSLRLGLALQGSQSWDQNQEFEDIFSQFFGGGGNARGGFGGFSGGFGGFQGFRAKGPDIHAHIRHVLPSFSALSYVYLENTISHYGVHVW